MRIKHLSLVASLLTPVVFAAPIPWSDALPLVGQANRLNQQCRDGSGDRESTKKACESREKVTEDLRRKGWCFGSPGQADYQKEWQLCAPAGTKSAGKPHNYSVEIDGAYGYEVEPSQVDGARGIASRPLVMARYKGILQGKHVIDIEKSNGIAQYTCAGDCQYLTYVRMTAGAYDKQIIKNDPTSVIGAIVDDMLAGRLQTWPRKASH